MTQLSNAESGKEEGGKTGGMTTKISGAVRKWGDNQVEACKIMKNIIWEILYRVLFP